jgi:hypothetical protein
MIGVLIMIAFFYVVVSPVNLLQLSPLFFYGSTLIFIGYDLLYVFISLALFYKLTLVVVRVRQHQEWSSNISAILLIVRTFSSYVQVRMVR